MIVEVPTATAEFVGDSPWIQNIREARQAVDEFVSEWLRFDLAVNAVKDRMIYPQFTPELAIAMTEETRRLVADLEGADVAAISLGPRGTALVDGRSQEIGG